jgi:transcriptional regulator with XRE-family HTH domain
VDLKTLPYFDLPQFIRERRETLNLSLEEMAARMKTAAPQTIDAWERGTTEVPLIRLQDLAYALTFDPNLLILLVLSRTMNGIWEVFDSKIHDRIAVTGSSQLRALVDGYLRPLTADAAACNE